MNQGEAPGAWRLPAGAEAQLSHLEGVPLCSHPTGWCCRSGFCPAPVCFPAECLWWCQAVWEGNMTWQDKVCRKFSSAFGQEPQREWDRHTHSATQSVTRPLTRSLPVTRILFSRFQIFNPSSFYLCVYFKKKNNSSSLSCCYCTSKCLAELTPKQNHIIES